MECIADHIRLLLGRLPAFAVPVMLIISNDYQPLPTNAAGKILKTSLREKAKAVWEQRKKLTRSKL